MTEQSAQGFLFCFGGSHEIEDPEIIQLELKYCERCGALWLRLRGTQEIYCPPCDLEMLDLPCPRRVPGKPQVQRNHKIEAKAQPTVLTVFAVKEEQHDRPSLPDRY